MAGLPFMVALDNLIALRVHRKTGMNPWPFDLGSSVGLVSIIVGATLSVRLTCDFKYIP